PAGSLPTWAARAGARWRRGRRAWCGLRPCPTTGRPEDSSATAGRSHGDTAWSLRSYGSHPFQSTEPAMAKPFLQLAALGVAGVALWKIASLFLLPDRKSTRLDSSHEWISYA